MTRTIEFYFDFPSPYSYLAHTQLPKIAAEHGATVTYHPFRILELMTIVGNRPTTIECKNKGKYAGVDLQRWTKRYNVDFSRNPHSKSFDYAELNRAALVAIEDTRTETFLGVAERDTGGKALPVFREYEERKHIAASVRKTWEKTIDDAVKVGKSVEEMPPRPEGAEEPPEPPLPRLRIGEATAEKVLEMLAVQRRGLLWARQELAGLLGGLINTEGARATIANCYSKRMTRVPFHATA